MNRKIVSGSIIGGIVITLVTGLIPNMPSMLLGATHYGLPLAWLIRLVIAPEYFPWRVNAANLVIDIVFWAIIVVIILFIIKRVRK